MLLAAVNATDKLSTSHGHGSWRVASIYLGVIAPARASSPGYRRGRASQLLPRGPTSGVVDPFVCLFCRVRGKCGHCYHDPFCQGSPQGCSLLLEATPYLDHIVYAATLKPSPCSGQLWQLVRFPLLSFTVPKASRYSFYDTSSAYVLRIIAHDSRIPPLEMRPDLDLLHASAVAVGGNLGRFQTHL
ncbi:hypothetical protein F5148DRAFT_1215804 [Russula earlei]|uniref:Uncharacterized protein n=1 Tax=Russula earlei TaxID=71964 RepID=A0ACC0U3V7_9AGAM|nr:hypothetical protein F5148DRAFT_1215804 [Russula earlei]